MPSNLISGTSCSIYPINHPTLPVGLPAQEYKHHAVQSATTGAIQEIVTIESNENTAFEIKLEINPTAYSLLHQSSDNSEQSDPIKEDDYLVYVYLDGISIQRSKRHRHQNGPTTISGVYSTDLKSSRTFQFGKLHLVDPDDDNRICQDKNIIQALGTIQVNIVRCLLGAPRPVPKGRARPHPNMRSRSTPPHRRTRDNPESLQTTNQMIFSERSKKACQLNTVGLSNPIPAHRGSHSSFQAKKTIRPVSREDPHPFLQFIFKYKPRSILEAEGIIAPPPPPPPSPPQASLISAVKKTDHPLVKKDTSNDNDNHDYVSNLELHQGSRCLDDRKIPINTEDEKKPNPRTTKPNYILIDSDDETDSSEPDTKRKVHEKVDSRPGRVSNGDGNKANQNRFVGGSGEKKPTKNRNFKSENGEQDENQPEVVDHKSPNHQNASGSKKRVRSLTTINDETNKRRSPITNGNGHEHEGGQTSSSKIEIHSPNESISDIRLRESQANEIYLDDSSEDDDTFQERITGSVRVNGFKNETKKKKIDDKRNYRQAYKANNNPIDLGGTQAAPLTTANPLREKLVNNEPNKTTPRLNFVDLTGLDSD